MLTSLSDGLPPLAMSYINMVEDVCGYRPWVHKSKAALFEARQCQLRQLGVTNDEYASHVVKVWWPWFRKKGIKTVPAVAFCGQRAWDRFLRTYENQQWVHIDTQAQDEWNDIVMVEHQAAQIYIGNKGDMSWVDAHRSACHLMPESLYTPSDLMEPAFLYVLSLLAELYSVPDAMDYDDIVDAIG